MSEASSIIPFVARIVALVTLLTAPVPAHAQEPVIPGSATRAPGRRPPAAPPSLRIVDQNRVGAQTERLLRVRTGLIVGAASSHALAAGLDAMAAVISGDCGHADEPGDPAPCQPARAVTLGLGLGSLGFHLAGFSAAASVGYVHGKAGAQLGRAPPARRTRAAAWVGGLLVSGGILGVALSGLATQDACDGGCDPRKAASASALRSLSAFAVDVGVGLLTWREGSRPVTAGVALGRGHVGASLSLKF